MIGYAVAGVCSLAISKLCFVSAKPIEQFGKGSGQFASKIISHATLSSSESGAAVQGMLGFWVKALSKITEIAGKSLSVLSTLFVGLGVGYLTASCFTLLGVASAGTIGCGVGLLAIASRIYFMNRPAASVDS